MTLGLQSLSLYYHTLKHLKAVQWYGQLKWRYYQPQASIQPAPPLRPLFTKPVAFIAASEQPCAPQQLTLIGITQNITPASIWHETSLDKLWRYHLHYFDYINTSEKHVWQQALMQRWCQENSRQRGDGWEPYPTSRRIVNWIKWLLQNEQVDSTLYISLATQIRYLTRCLEYHLLANHLFANAKALIFAGAFFSGKEGARWLKKGYALLQQEVSQQILMDGGHIERSPMYHAIVLHDLLDCINMLQAYHLSVPKLWMKHAQHMLIWLRYLSHPDGEIAFFNDSTSQMSENIHALTAYYDRIYPREKISSPGVASCLLPDSGFARLQNADLVLIADVGGIAPHYQPGHAHAETLSFELSLGSQRVFVNSGISTYNVGTKRLRQRGTAAHNTVVIDGQNSSQVWQGFRVAQRANVIACDCMLSNAGLKLQATHDGYWDSKKVLHQRTWCMSDKCITIRDCVLGGGHHRLIRYFHLHPAIQVTQFSSHCVILSWLQSSREIMMETDGVIEVLPSQYHPEFNREELNYKLVIETSRRLPIELNTVIKVIARA